MSERILADNRHLGLLSPIAKVQLNKAKVKRRLKHTAPCAGVSARWGFKFILYYVLGRTYLVLNGSTRGTEQ